MPPISSRRGAVAALVLSVLGAPFAGGSAFAQPAAAYRVGMKIAMQRQYPNPGCYAGVFARHARPSNHEGKRNYWSARTGRAFKGELWSQCRISR